MKFIFILFVFIVNFALPVYAEDVAKNEKTFSEEEKTIVLTPVQVLNISKKMIEDKKYAEAKFLLNKSVFNIKELEIERLHLIATVYILEEKIDDAIEIYKYILNYEPNISSIRLKLAELYLLKGAYYKAGYHFKLAASDRNLPKEVQNNIAMALYFIRQNKNWNFWFNFGAAPDNNINNATGGEQCLNTPFGIVCNQLAEKERAIGFNVSFGGNYEFKLSDKWRLRNEFTVYASEYDKSQYNDLYLSYVIGGKYIWKNGDVFPGITFSKRWLGGSEYNKSIGGKVDLDYDFTKSVSGAFGFYFTPTYYDDYSDILNGNIYGMRSRLFYAFDSSKYIMLKLGYEKENTKDKIYTNTKKSFAVGLGIELPYGFSVYLEPSVQYVDYAKERWFVNKNMENDFIEESDTTRKYALSLSNRNIKIWGFIPNLTYVYTDKSSNIWQKEYAKSTVEFTVNQNF